LNRQTSIKISVITVVRNAEQTIADALDSVSLQKYDNIEHIIIDGASNDGTVKIIESFMQRNPTNVAQFVSEPDNGIYDAMNKGVEYATGDVVGLLNADDVYQDDTVLEQVALAHQDHSLDACYADLVYVQNGNMNKVVRYWKSNDYTTGLSFNGWMPAHPTLYLKRRVYQQAGQFRTDLKYQSDLEFCTRLFEKYKISSLYIPKIWVRMRLGGVTNNSVMSILKGNWESYRALQELGLKCNPATYFSIKFWSRIKQFFKRVDA